ncbi:hypothetical protein K9N68_34215 (plasmid) [Kovacikia minuta CCNUW1]|uniref:hypothetical protein n=1 Tax=Kovacikia minuta TaxID=2931930 RepID=UPI001CD02CD4|nr:hypothetical protein [Kovacikia minuta]UBF30273.1 hypothetical protein K9N68_34215 [Kovacikia minuta CCNUW1]
MVFKKRRSRVLEKAQSRLSGLQSINPAMNLGSGLTLQGYADLLQFSSTQLQNHNAALAEADRTRIEFAQTEASVSALSSRILSAVAAAYGKDSKEYEMAGGKPPKSYRRAKGESLAASLTQAQPGSPLDASAPNGTTTNGAKEVASAS